MTHPLATTRPAVPPPRNDIRYKRTIENLHVTRTNNDEVEAVIVGELSGQKIRKKR